MSDNYSHASESSGQESARANPSSSRRQSTSSLSKGASNGLGPQNHQRKFRPGQFRRSCKLVCRSAASSLAEKRDMDSHQTPAGSSPSDSCRLSRVGARRAARNPALHQKLRQMALPLAPLVQVTSGEVHQAFPRNLLSFWLLTDEQLDSLAVFYHQRDPSNWTLQYPCPIVWRPGMTVEEKRRKLGKFIGLRGCDTPIEEWKRLQAQHGKSSEMLRLRTEEEIVIAARRAREQEELFKRKVNWY